MVSTLSLNWIHLIIIGAAAFHIIGLEFLLLDWIYRSIRIMTAKMHLQYTCWHNLGSQAMYRQYTEGVWPIHINDLNCTGSEKSVWECPHNGIEGYSCYHYQDASVMCQGK